MISLLFFLNGYEDKESKEALRDKIKAFIFMSLSVISNFSFLNVYLALICTYVIIEAIVAYPVFKKTLSFNLLKDKVKNEFVYILIITISLALLIYRPLSIMSGDKDFYGEKTGFWHDTVTSLINASLYNKAYSFDVIYFFNIFIILILVIVFY